MEEEIKYIKKVEINKLWGYEDLNFVWNLNPDVNILAGDNGSGKSTILNLIINVILLKNDNLTKFCKNINLIFNNLENLVLVSGVETLSGIEKKAQNDKTLEMVINKLITNAEYKDVKSTSTISYSYIIGATDKTKSISDNLSLINTFEQSLKSEESIKKLTNDEVKTELDLQIFNLQKQYLEYQLNIGNRAIKALENGENGAKKIYQKKNLFLDTIDTLFSHTQKKIDRTKNEITFIQRGERAISPYQLSSGEKQMLIILLTTLVQDNKYSILIMDEPEISLHTDWQENLIDNIRKLNENVQIIIATHSPSIVLNGWKDKVFEMSEIQVKN